MCDAIYIGNTQQTFKKRMDGHLSDILRLLNNRQKSDSFASHFNSTLTLPRHVQIYASI